MYYTYLYINTESNNSLIWENASITNLTEN